MSKHVDCGSFVSAMGPTFVQRSQCGLSTRTVRSWATCVLTGEGSSVSLRQQEKYEAELKRVQESEDHAGKTHSSSQVCLLHHTTAVSKYLRRDGVACIVEARLEKRFSVKLTSEQHFHWIQDRSPEDHINISMQVSGIPPCLGPYKQDVGSFCLSWTPKVCKMMAQNLET